MLNLARSCTRCLPRPSTVVARAAGAGVRSLSVSSPAFKKHASKRFEEDEGEFEEDFIDDVDLAPADSPLGGGGSATGTREQRHAEALARVQRITGLARYRLAAAPPSPSLLTALLTHSTAATLGDTLASIEQWRNKSLPLLAPAAVRVLVQRLAQLDGPAALESAAVLADRAKYGVEVDDVKTLYPLFARLSRPTAVAPDVDPRLERQTATLVDLLTLARQHAPASTAADAFAHVATLASALQSSRTPTTPGIERLVAHVEQLGEDFILQEAANRLSKRERLVLRFRAMRVTDELRKKQHAEVEWFAHLTERLVVLTK
ncbi:hypothetical protein JCM11491_000581 [Sporobolomyces phaffii]